MLASVLALKHRRGFPVLFWAFKAREFPNRLDVPVRLVRPGWFGPAQLRHLDWLQSH